MYAAVLEGIYVAIFVAYDDNWGFANVCGFVVTGVWNFVGQAK